MVKPSLLNSDFIKLLPDVDSYETPLLVGIRGFFSKGNNQRGIFDDAIFYLENGFNAGFNGNTDPSKIAPGLAVLQPGTYEYIQGLHGVHHIDFAIKDDRDAYEWLLANKGKDHPNPKYRLTYWALRQHSNVTVKRDGDPVAVTDTPGNRFWIDIHHGGVTGTSSEGCQTIALEQWSDFRQQVYAAMDTHKMEIIKYYLIENL